MASETSRINFFKRSPLTGGEPRKQIAFGAPVRVVARQLAHNDRGDLRARRFWISGVDAVVSDHRRRHHDGLSVKGRIGKDLLVTGHVRGEHYLRHGRLSATE